MLPSYDDITSRISEPPLWYDGNGCPRYDSFKPGMLGVYDEVCLLGQIRCQGCHKHFQVAWSTSVMNEVRHQMMLGEKLSVPDWEEILANACETVPYGDPPSHGGCTGETMSCDPVAIVQAWIKARFEWERRPALERVFPPDER